MNLVRTTLLVAAALLLMGSGQDATRFAVPSPPPKLNKPAVGVLFATDFSRDSLKHWKADRPGVWSIWRGMLRADLPDQKQLRSLIHTGDTAWTDVADRMVGAMSDFEIECGEGTASDTKALAKSAEIAKEFQALLAKKAP